MFDKLAIGSLVTAPYGVYAPLWSPSGHHVALDAYAAALGYPRHWKRVTGDGVAFYALLPWQRRVAVERGIIEMDIEPDAYFGNCFSGRAGT